MDAILEKALTSAPFLVIGLAGVAYIARLFLKHITQSEEARRQWAEGRHAEFFEVIRDSTERSNQCIHDNTQVMGKVLGKLDKN